MKIFITLFLCVFSSVLYAFEGNCVLDGEKQNFSLDHPLCLFYTGTEYYREEQYSEALKQWELLFVLEDYPEEYDALKIDASNNLGYLYYHALGEREML